MLCAHAKATHARSLKTLRNTADASSRADMPPPPPPPSSFDALATWWRASLEGEEQRAWEPDRPVPDQWLDDPQQHMAFWRNAAASSANNDIDGLERAMASTMLRRLLVQNKYLQPATTDGGDLARFTKWPSRDRHQLWATLWLALRFLPGRIYEEEELRAYLTSRLVTPEEALVFALREDLLRRELIVRCSPEDPTPDAAGGSAFTLSRPKLDFVLEGDKLFEVRAAVASRRPWWQLPIGTQYIAAPRPAADAQPRGTRFRCVLLDERPTSAGDDKDDGGDRDAEDTRVGAMFIVGKSGGGADGGGGELRRCVLEEGGARFVAILCTFEAPTTVSEVRLSVAPGSRDAGGDAPQRLPPFRVEVFSSSPPTPSPDTASTGEWRLLQCQPMPTADEMCNAGRDAVRCFLPNAVPVRADVVPPDGAAALFEGGPPNGAAWRVKRWPTKVKQQAQVVQFLASHLLAGVLYSDHEIDWLITTRHALSCVPDCPTIRKEFERQRLVERQPGGGGFLVPAAGAPVAPTDAEVSVS